MADKVAMANPYYAKRMTCSRLEKVLLDFVEKDIVLLAHFLGTIYKKGLRSLSRLVITVYSYSFSLIRAFHYHVAVSSIRATSWQNQQNDCAPSEDSDQPWHPPESSLCTQWVAKNPSFLHADSEDSDQTGQMPRLIWVFAGRTCHFVCFVTRRLIWHQRQ